MELALTRRNGKPLLNQTIGLTPQMAKQAFGTKLTQIAQTRKQYDPSGRLLNDYFRGLLSS